MTDNGNDQGYSLRVQPHGPFDFYDDGRVPTVERALGLLEAAKIAVFSEDGDEVEFVFAGDDRLSIIGPDGVELKAWSRDKGDIGPDLTSVGKAPIVGWQIVNAEGFNIHGDDDDPFGLASFEILTEDAVRTAITWAARKEGYAVVPAREGDIEEPSFVGNIFEVPSPSMVP